MSFAWPWCFVLLPLPWLLRHWLAPGDTEVALRLPQLPTSLGATGAPRM